MEKLKKKIEAEGTCLGTDLIKVDAFLNHQIDPVLMEQIATTFYEQAVVLRQGILDGYDGEILGELLEIGNHLDRKSVV